MANIKETIHHILMQADSSDGARLPATSNWSDVTCADCLLMMPTTERMKRNGTTDNPADRRISMAPGSTSPLWCPLREALADHMKKADHQPWRIDQTDPIAAALETKLADLHDKVDRLAFKHSEEATFTERLDAAFNKLTIDLSARLRAVEALAAKLADLHRLVMANDTRVESLAAANADLTRKLDVTNKKRRKLKRNTGIAVRLLVERMLMAEGNIKALLHAYPDQLDDRLSTVEADIQRIDIDDDHGRTFAEDTRKMVNASVDGQWVKDQLTKQSKTVSDLVDWCQNLDGVDRFDGLDAHDLLTELLTVSRQGDSVCLRRVDGLADRIDVCQQMTNTELERLDRQLRASSTSDTSPPVTAAVVSACRQWLANPQRFADPGVDWLERKLRAALGDSE